MRRTSSLLACASCLLVLTAFRCPGPDPLIDPVAAISCGIYAGQAVLDLDYPEDSEAGVDGNFVMTGTGRLIEVQMSAEGATFSRAQMDKLLDLAGQGVAQLASAQRDALD